MCPVFRFGQYNGVGSNTVDRADLNQLNKVNTSLSGEVIAHEIIEGYVGVAEGLTTYKTAHIRADEFFGNVAVSNLKLLPEGAETATGGSAIYNFQRVGVSVKVEKTFITPQPAASISNLGTEPGHLKVTTVEPPKTTTPQTKEKKP